MIDLSLVLDGTWTTDPPTGTAITNSRASTNIIDWLTGRDVGAGEVLGIHVDILTTFSTTNSATLQIQYEVCSTTNGTFLPLILSPAVAAAELIVGCPLFRYALPVNQEKNASSGILSTPGRYGRLTYTVGTGVFSAGAVAAWISPRWDRREYFNYPSGYSVAIAAGEI